MSTSKSFSTDANHGESALSITHVNSKYCSIAPAQNLIMIPEPVLNNKATSEPTLKCSSVKCSKNRMSRSLKTCTNLRRLVIGVLDSDLFFAVGS